MRERSSTRRRRTVLCAALVALCLPGVPALSAQAAPAAPPPPAAPAPAAPRADELVVQRADTRAANAMIGDDTERAFGVQGADLGHMFVAGDRLATTFGDTYGAPRADPFFAVRHADWRSNVMGFVDPPASPALGLRMSDMVTDRPGHAKELLASQKTPGREQTVIPTYGIAVGPTMYLQYMSVRRFDEPGHWSLNSSGVASSGDGGRTWTKAPGAVWPGDSRFGQVAYVRPGGADDPDAPGDPDEVYAFGIPGGRYGGVSLAKVPADRLADRASYRYWTGSTWKPGEAAAGTVVPAPAGELSVRWSAFHHAWLMMYLVDPTGEIVLRSADTLTGPWSDPQVVTSTKDYPDAYAPYITPMWNDGPDVWFTMSQFGPYRTRLMHTLVGTRPAGSPLPSAVAPTPSTGVRLGPSLTLPFAHGRGM